jgi:hypothetical protein
MARDHGRVWRIGEYLGLVSDKPKPARGSREWWLSLLSAVPAVLGVILIERFHWFGL